MKPLVFSSLSKNDVFLPFYGLLMKFVYSEPAWALCFPKALKTGLKTAVHHLK